MFILHNEKPYYFNEYTNKVFGVSIDALTYKVDDAKAAPAPEETGPWYTIDEIRAVLGINKQEVVNKRTGIMETVSTKTVSSSLDGKVTTNKPETETE